MIRSFPLSKEDSTILVDIHESERWRKSPTGSSGKSSKHRFDARLSFVEPSFKSFPLLILKNTSRKHFEYNSLSGNVKSIFETLWFVILCRSTKIVETYFERGNDLITFPLLILKFIFRECFLHTSPTASNGENLQKSLERLSYIARWFLIIDKICWFFFRKEDRSNYFPITVSEKYPEEMFFTHFPNRY